MATTPLSIYFRDNLLTFQFNDYSKLLWDPTQDPSTAQHIKTFGASPGALAQAHKDVIVIQDPTAYTFVWFMSAPDVTITVPAGPLTVGSLLDIFYQASSQTISNDDYNNITGDTWSGAGQPKVSDAIKYGQDGPVTMGNLGIVDGNTVFPRIYSVS